MMKFRQELIDAASDFVPPDGYVEVEGVLRELMDVIREIIGNDEAEVYLKVGRDCLGLRHDVCVSVGWARLPITIFAFHVDARHGYPVSVEDDRKPLTRVCRDRETLEREIVALLDEERILTLRQYRPIHQGESDA